MGKFIHQRERFANGNLTLNVHQLAPPSTAPASPGLGFASFDTAFYADFSPDPKKIYNDFLPAAWLPC
jgi:hypothetical protein